MVVGGPDRELLPEGAVKEIQAVKDTQAWLDRVAAVSALVFLWLRLVASSQALREALASEVVLQETLVLP